MSEPSEREKSVNVAVHDAVDWDSRKHLLDIWQSAGGPMPTVGADWDEGLYPALIAVAQQGARRAVENTLDDAEDARHGF